MANIDRVQGTLRGTVTVDRVQGLSGTLGVKTPVVAATTGSITLAGLQTVDGVALGAGDRVLVKNQASAVTNGIYVVATGDWQRDIDFDGAADLRPGGLVFVASGTVNGQKGYMFGGTAPLTPGTTTVTFSEVADFTGASAFGTDLYGAADAAAGRVLLEAAEAGPNASITSLSGLTTPLSVAQGGTGGATQAAALVALGAALNGVLDKSSTGTFTAQLSERGKLFDWTTSGHVGYLPAASGNAGLVYGFRSSIASGTNTVNPNGTELIDGASTAVLTAGEACLCVCDGTGWKTIGRTLVPASVPTYPSFPLSVANGGTSASSASAARDALSLVSRDQGLNTIGSFAIGIRESYANTPGSTYTAANAGLSTTYHSGTWCCLALFNPSVLLTDASGGVYVYLQLYQRIA